MKDLFLAECRRFRNAALAFAAVHLLLQLLLNRVTDFAQARWEFHVLALGLYMLAGMAFALYQLGSYRQPARWVWLLHRPLPRGAVFGAIAGASGALILFAVGLPLLATVAGIDWLAGRTVDARHYAMVAYIVLMVAIAWLAGACVILGRSRSAIAVLVLPALVLLRLAPVASLLPAAMACTALLALAAYGCFKPDRASAPGHPLVLAATCLPLLLGFYFALAWGGSVAFQLGQMAAGVHPLSRAVPLAGGSVELAAADARGALGAGLEASNDPRAARWRRQLALLNPGFTRPLARQFPVRGQLSNLETLQWNDDTRHIGWTFDHDAMRFHGRDLRTGADRGWFGPRGAGDANPFPELPVLFRPDWIMTPHRVYQVDSDNQAVRLVTAAGNDEVLTGPPKEVGAHMYTLTNRRLAAHPRDAHQGTTLPELWSVGLPGPLSDLERVDIAELLEGTLVSFDYGRAMHEGVPGSRQTVFFVDAAGHAQMVATRLLAQDYPLLFEHAGWWVSPLLHALATLPSRVFDDGRVADHGQARDNGELTRPRPLPVVAAAVLASLAAVLLCWLRLRAGAMPPRRKAGWLLACALLGLPALLCVLVLEPRPRAAPLPRAAAVPA